MTYSTHDLDRLSTGETVYTADAASPARHFRRRRHAHVMGSHTGGARLTGFGL